MADNKSRESIASLKVKVDVDVSEAITGLKALQREAKEAARALRELEAYRRKDVQALYPSDYLTVTVDGKELAKAVQKQSRLDSRI